MLMDIVPQLAVALSTFDWSSLGLPLLWFGVVILAFVVEGITAEMVAIWFAPGAFVSMILAFFEVPFTVQLSVFVIITVIGLILTFAVFKPLRKKHKPIEKTNADALTGQIAMVEEEVNNLAATGVVRVNGQLWTARMTNDNDIPQKGDWIEIVEVAGTKLICKPKE